MSFISGSITDANPGPALYALMATALTSAGFTLVDTVTISTRTHKVWKSPAAANVQNLDWFLDIGYTSTGAGTISLITFEHFDPATDLGYRGPVNAGSGIDAATGSRYGATGYALETNWFGAHTASSQTALTTTAFGYWISITADRVILLCSGAPSVVMYAGLYAPDPLYSAKAGAALFPLFTGVVAGTSTNAALTRIPPQATSLAWSNTVNNLTLLTSYYPSLPSGLQTNYPYAGNPVGIGSGNAGVFARYGWLLDVYLVNTSGVVRGDTCTIGGASHVLTTTSTGSWAFKAA